MSCQTYPDEVVQIPMAQLEPNPWNCNEMTEAEVKTLELSMSQGDKANVSPLMVRRLGRDRFQIIDGEHRLTAAKRLHWTTMPCIIQEVDDGRTKALCLALNYIRGKTNPIKLFELLYADWEGGGGKLSTRQLEAAYDHTLDQSWITRLLQLRNLAPEVKEEAKRLFEEGHRDELTAKHLIAISQLESADEQARFLRALVTTGASSTTLERMIRDHNLEGPSEESLGPGAEDGSRSDECSSTMTEEPRSRRGKAASILTCECGSAYSVNWRRRWVARLVETDSVVMAVQVQLSDEVDHGVARATSPSKLPAASCR